MVGTVANESVWAPPRLLLSSRSSLPDETVLRVTVASDFPERLDICILMWNLPIFKDWSFSQVSLKRLEPAF